MLKLSSLTAGYGEKVVLRKVSLGVEKGEIATLIGANGAGKSTTFKAIIRLIPIFSGVVEFEGERINALSPPDIVGRGMVLVPEGRKIFTRFTVLENLKMGAFVQDFKLNRLAGDIEEAFQLFPILRERRKQLGGTLSGGEQQMLAIARALMAKPKLVLLDEPSMGLAPLLVENVFAKIREINERGVTLLLVEQNATMALSLAGKGYIIENGRIILGDSCAALKGNPKVMEAYLGAV